MWRLFAQRPQRRMFAAHEGSRGQNGNTHPTHVPVAHRQALITRALAETSLRSPNQERAVILASAGTGGRLSQCDSRTQWLELRRASPIMPGS
jgi:hypothetical protein